MNNRYVSFVKKNHSLLLGLVVILYVIMVPIGMNSINILGADIRTYLLDEEEDDVLSITSISNDLIIIIDGDENLFSQSVYDWIAELSFEISTGIELPKSITERILSNKSTNVPCL